MTNKLRLLAFVTGALLLSAGAGATSLTGEAAERIYGTQQMEYMETPVSLGGCGVPCDEPYPADIFLRGTFNDWGLTDQMIYGGDGIYEVVISLDAGEWEFKIASEDWNTVDLGGQCESAEGDCTVIPAFVGVPYEMNSGPFANMFIDIAQAGDYRFVLDASNGTHSPSNPLLTISLVGPMPMPAPGTLALIGLGLVIFVARRGRNSH